MKPNQIKPLNNRIFIKIVKEEEILEFGGGLIAPPSYLASKEKSNIAEVIDVSLEYNGNIGVGDKIIFNKNSGAVIPFNEREYPEEYRLIKEEDILSKVV